MKNICLFTVAMQALLCPCALLSAQMAEDAWVTVVPRQTEEILSNPGMGWETFHRTASQDKNLPSWMPSSVHYLRWGWRELEPERGRLNTTLLDDALKRSRQARQTLAFRVMCCSSTSGQPYHPKWLREMGGRIIKTRHGFGRAVEIPDLDDPIVLKAHLDFIKRLGERYDGHPDLDHVDLGSVGWWGEWHMSKADNAKMPALENQKKIVDAYLAAFRKTPLLMLVGGGKMLEYAVGQGTGWRADSLGDMGGFWKKWSHMRNAYPVWLPEANAVDAWKRSPVAWETGGDMRYWVFVGYSLRHIFNYALALHASYINNKSAPLPPGDHARAEVKRFLRRLGYRLVLKQLKHPAEVTIGKQLKLSMKWQNVGSAPCYRPYRLAYRLRNEQGLKRVLVGNATVNHWLPGSIELFTEAFFRQPADLPPGKIVSVVESIDLPADLPAGSYSLSIGVVGEKSNKPVVRLAIEGREDDGWYPVSRVKLVK